MYLSDSPAVCSVMRSCLTWFQNWVQQNNLWISAQRNLQSELPVRSEDMWRLFIWSVLEKHVYLSFCASIHTDAKSGSVFYRQQLAFTCLCTHKPTRPQIDCFIRSRSWRRMFAGLPSCCLFNNSYLTHLSRNTFALSAPVWPAERGDGITSSQPAPSRLLTPHHHHHPQRSCLYFCQEWK